MWLCRLCDCVCSCCWKHAELRIFVNKLIEWKKIFWSFPIFTCGSWSLIVRLSATTQFWRLSQLNYIIFWLFIFSLQAYTSWITLNHRWSSWTLNKGPRNKRLFRSNSQWTSNYSRKTSDSKMYRTLLQEKKVSKPGTIEIASK